MHDIEFKYGLTVINDMHTNEIEILIKLVSTAEDMISGSCQCYRLLLETLVDSWKRYVLTKLNVGM